MLDECALALCSGCRMMFPANALKRSGEGRWCAGCYPKAVA
jgi:hypothetical protein